MTKSMKRIRKVVVKRMFDDSPDTSWLGEYANKPKDEYTIDREHALDCIANTHLETDDTLCSLCEQPKGKHNNFSLACPSSEADQDWEEDQSFEPIECDCGESGDRLRNEYRYFNGPVENYKGESPEDIRKYVLQDYKRMQELQRGDFCFIGIRAEAEIEIPSDHSARAYLRQDITSGGLWGIESDSNDSYFKEVEQEELSELRKQLAGVGFSQRAITAAFRTLEHESE